MKTAADGLLLLAVLLNLSILGSSRMTTAIQRVSWQGMVLGALPLVLHGGPSVLRLWTLTAFTILLKGFVFPRLLLRSLRSADIRKEVDPIVGLTTSVAIGVILLAVSFSLSRRLSLPIDHVHSPLVLPVSLATILCGLFLIVARRQALMQVIGYLVLENGIFVLGAALAHEEPFLVEMGVLLDVFVGVFVMGIAVFHISRAFDHIDVDQLSQLKG